MTDQDLHKDIIRRIYEEGFNEGKLDWIDEFILPSYLQHMPDVAPGPEGVRAAMRDVIRAFPDAKISVEDLIAEGDRVVARVRTTGTHLADYMGIPATESKIDYETMHIFRFSEGKLAEHWAIADRVGMMQQLGAIPPMERAA